MLLLLLGVTSGLPLPLGEQELPLPYRSSADHHAALRPVPGVVFWPRHRGHSSPRRLVPPCLAHAQWSKTHLSSLPHLCPEGADQTHVGPHPVLSSFRRRPYAARDLVHPRAGQSHRKGFGYTLVKIHEVWHFPPEQRRTGQVSSRTMSTRG